MLKKRENVYFFFWLKKLGELVNGSHQGQKNAY